MSASFKALEEKAHCSCHTFFMNGCLDCSTSQSYKEHTEKLQKTPILLGTTPLVIKPRDKGPKAQLITQQLARALAIFFSGAAKVAAKAAGKKARALTKISEDEEKDIALAAFLAIEWDSLVDNVALPLRAAYQTGAEEAIQQLNLTSEETTGIINQAAVDYANKRAAEMIGKKYVDEKLVDDPEAKYVIAETTKDDIQDVVEKASSDNLTITEMEERIKLAGTFADLRMAFIANNEIAVAQTAGHLDIWQRSLIVTKINVVLNPAHEIYDLCDEHAAGSPYNVNEVPVLPAHPYCMCGYEVVEIVQ